MFESAGEFFLRFSFFLLLLSAHRSLFFSSSGVILKPESGFKSNTQTGREDRGKKEGYSCSVFLAILNVMLVFCWISALISVSV